MKQATRLTSKGQVVIPKKVRARLRWRPGLKLDVEASDDGAVILRPAFRHARDLDSLVDEVSGFLTEGDPLSELEAEHQAEIASDEQERRRHR
jgi:AbrB family looped-hinge helix DNA binding protein